MLFNPRARKSGLMLLIEHLDAVAFAIEGLEEQKFELAAPAANASADEILDYQYALRSFVENVRVRELSLIAHVDRARLQANRLRKYDAGISAYARLFNGGTQAFADHLAERDHVVTNDFDGNDQVINFLLVRKLASADCLSVEETGVIACDERYWISGLLPMSVLGQQVESFLNLIENHELLDVASEIPQSRVGQLRKQEDRALEEQLSA